MIIETYQNGARTGVTGQVEVDEVNEEAERRIWALLGVRDFKACMYKETNLLMRATALVDRKHERALTVEEEAEAAAIEVVKSAIARIRHRSNELARLYPAIPADFTADSHW